MDRGEAYRELDRQFDLVIEGIMAGTTITKLSQELLPTCKPNTARTFYNKWRRQLDHARAAELWAAMRDSGERWDEKAGEALEDAASDKDEIARAKLVSQLHQWRAGVHNPERYKPAVVPTAVQVNTKIDLGDLFAQALQDARDRALGAAPTPLLAAPDEIVVAPSETVYVREPASVRDLL